MASTKTRTVKLAIEIPEQWLEMVDLMVEDGKSKQPSYSTLPLPKIDRDSEIRRALESGLRALSRGILMRRQSAAAKTSSGT